MAMSLDEFVTCLSTSGVFSTEESKELEQSYPPQKRPRDIQAFARELVGAGKLTKYQAAAIYQGQAASLVFGEYVVLDKLGAGGMGHVFRARHRRMKRVVALKVLPLKAMRTPRAVERFYQEVHTAAQLLHPNIVTAYDANEANGLHYLAMEYVDGRDLGMILKQTGPMPMDKVVDYLIQAAKGLEFAHKQGIIHRDIKPANLLLDKKGRVKVLDMGLARVADSMSDADEAAAQGLTQQGEVMGTIDYMAPEQMQDARSVDLRADIYSLGCSMYTLLTHKPAFSGETLVKKMLARIEKPLPKITEIRTDLPPAIDELLHRMIDKDRDQRFATMTDLIAALEAFRASGYAGAVIEPAAEHVLGDEPRTAGSSLAQFLDDTEVSGRSRLGQGLVTEPAPEEAEPTYSSRRRQATGKSAASRSKPERSKAGKGSSATNKIPPKVLIGGAAAAIVVIAALAMMLGGGSDEPNEQIAAGPETVVADESQPEPEKPKEGFSFDFPAPGGGNGGEAPVANQPTAPSPIPVVAAVEPGPPLAGPVDLLATVDPARDQLVGQWKVENGALMAPNTPYARFQFQLVPPTEYVLEATVERPSGSDSLALGLVVGGRQVRAIFDANLGTITGLDMIGGRRFEQNATTLLGRAFRDNLPHVIKTVVQPGSVVATFDDTTLLDWKGNANQLSLSMGTADLPLPDRLFLTTHNTPFVIRKLLIRPLETVDRAPASPRPAMLGPYDLLSFVRVPRDVVAGEWLLQGRRLTCDPPAENAAAKLHFPLTPPAEYKLTVVAEKVWGKDSFGVALPVGNRRVGVSFDNGGGRWGGLEVIDGLRANQNETHWQGAIFSDKTPHTFVYRVRQGNIQVTCDGNKLIDWTGDFQRLNPVGHLSTPRPDAFVLGGWGTSYCFTKVELEPYDLTTQPSPSGPTPGATPTPVPTVAAAATVDLLKDIDPQRDTFGGLWTRTPQGLLGGSTGPGGPHQSIQINYHPPAEYRWDATVTRTAGNDPFVMGVFGGGRQFVVVLDQRAETRISRVDGAPDETNNPTRLPGSLFTNGKPAQVACVVRKEGVVVTVDGREVIKWAEYQRLSNITRKIKDPLALFVGVVSSPFLISKLELTPLLPEANGNGPLAGSGRPADDAIQIAALALQDEHRDKYQASRTSPSERTNLVEALRAEAAKVGVDPARRFAALREVYQLGVDYVDLPLALQAIADLATAFGVDREPLEKQAIDARAAAAKLPAERKTLVTEAFALVEDAIAKEQYVLASRLHDMAQAEVLKIRDPALLKEARAREPILKEWEKLKQQADAARQVLAAQADDGTANTALGLYECLVLGNWQSGLPHLAKGSEEPFRKLAQQDLSKPSSSEDRAALAEGWWLAGDKANPTTKINLFARSEYWYRQAVLNLTGAPRAKAQQRLQKIDEARKAAPAILVERHPIDAIPYNGHWYKVFTDRRGWREAKVACEQAGGYLVCFETPEEQKFVAQLARQLPGDPNTMAFWIGLTDEAQEGKFVWINGAPLSFTAWDQINPSNSGGNEHYGELIKLGQSSVAGIWNDVPVGKQSFYICEWGR